MCCFSDLSQNHLRGWRRIKIKGKTSQKLQEKAKYLEKLSIKKNISVFRMFPNFCLMINVQEDPRNDDSIVSGLIASNYHYFTQCVI